MQMIKTKIKLSLVYGFLTLFGASLSAGLFYAYGFPITEPLGHFVGDTLSLSDYITLSCVFLKPLIFIFLSGFTIYACTVGGISCFYVGLVMGQLVIRYCLSGLNPFTHAAGFAFFLGIGALYTLLSIDGALFRNSLRNAAPDPRDLVRSTPAVPFFRSFLSAAAITVAVTSALYFFLFYFPI